MIYILQNERHCGNVPARKTWTPNYIDNRPRKNRHDRNQYKSRDHHEAIVSREDFIAVQKLIDNAEYGNYGMFISPKPCIGGICAVAALKLIYTKYGFQNLQRTLNLCIGTWEGEREAFSANMLKSVAFIVSEFEDSLKYEHFKIKLSKVSVREISRAAAERRTGTSRYADAIMTYYNKRMKVR